jgi:glutathione S-transferase
MADSLHFLSGSPFARMARVLLREWSLPVAEVEHGFPLPADWFEQNPLGQVPVLALGGEQIFPTFLILERLWELAGRPAAAYAPATDRQILLTTLQAGDALATAAYIKWTGLESVRPNHIGFDLAPRNYERCYATLAWLAELRRVGKLRDGITLCGVALAALVLWADAREGLDWRRHPELAQLVDALEARPSFQGTKPRAWKPGD